MAYSLEDLYRKVIMNHYRNPRNYGAFDHEVLTVKMNNQTCGDSIQLQLKIENGVVVDIRFEGKGCSICIASASIMTQAVKGQTVEEVIQLTNMVFRMMKGENVGAKLNGEVLALQGVCKFPARIKCATLAWKAMQKGVMNHGYK